MTGLTEEQVKERIEAGQTNADENPNTRTYKQIVKENTLTFFNFLNLVLLVLVLMVGSFKNAFFVCIIIINTLIGIAQEIRAKKTIDKLAILTAKKSIVLREGKKWTVPTEELVLDDVVCLKTGDQVPADARILEGSLEVNESLLTGEADNLPKNPGDELFSGSFVTSGEASCQIIHVGKDNYASQITSEAKEFKRHNSELRNSLNIILKVISIIIVPIGAMLFYKQYYMVGDSFRDSIVSMVAGVLGMIPEGLVLLTSVALTLGALVLANKKTLVQELYCIETLARVDTLCLDKTGTITEGSMCVERVEPFIRSKEYQASGESQMEEGAAAEALSRQEASVTEKTGQEEVSEPEKTEQPGSAAKAENTEKIAETKNTAGTENGKQAELFSEEPKAVDLKDIEEIMCSLMHVLRDENATANALRKRFPARPVMACEHVIPFSSDRKYSGAVFAEKGTYLMGAVQFLFPENNQDMISQAQKYAEEGLRVLVLAHSPEKSEGTELPKNLEPVAFLLLTEQDVQRAVSEYSVFGRVTPQQKKQMVQALKSQGHTVAMTGDGVNDVLALKEADCSIAMAQGSDAAKNIANVVLLDSNFASMPHIVNQGRRVVNNIRTAASMFLIKTMFSVMLSILTIFFGNAYPFEPIQMSLISACAVGIPTFLLAQENNYDKIDHTFLRHVFLNAFPAAITISSCVFTIMLVCQNVYHSNAMLNTACVLVTGWNYMAALKTVYAPLNRYRKVIIYGMQFIFFAAAVIFQNLLSLGSLDFGMIILVFILMTFAPVLIDVITGWIRNIYARSLDKENPGPVAAFLTKLQNGKN